MNPLLEFTPPMSSRIAQKFVVENPKTRRASSNPVCLNTGTGYLSFVTCFSQTWPAGPKVVDLLTWGEVTSKFAAITPSLSDCVHETRTGPGVLTTLAKKGGEHAEAEQLRLMGNGVEIDHTATECWSYPYERSGDV